ncbi:MAG TPA: hypothetical protein VMH92_05900 [Acidocella sp.]|nr:hypothetical protein [Acidocella sp.]
MSEPVTLTDKLGRKIVVQEPGIEDQFDMLEAAGANSSNQAWIGLATLVFTAQSIDGAPLPRPQAKAHFKRNAALLKNEGVEAIANYFKEVKGESAQESEIAAAKN